MDLELEYYLIETKSTIMTINIISKMIDSLIRNHYVDITKQNNCRNYIDKILALNNAIQMIGYCMRVFHLECYKKLDPDYQDDFTYSSVMSEE